MNARKENQSLALHNIAVQISEITSNFETFGRVFSNMSNDTLVENEISRDELIIECEELLPIACDDFRDDCE